MRKMILIAVACGSSCLAEKGIFPEPSGSPKEATAPIWVEEDEPADPAPSTPDADKDKFPVPQ